jgi:hypothetical protein
MNVQVWPLTWCKFIADINQLIDSGDTTLSGRRFLLEKLIFAQIVKKYRAFYQTRKSITVFRRARHWTLSWARCIQSRPSHHCFSNIHFNIVFPSTRTSSEWSFPLKFSDRHSVWTYNLTHACYRPHPPHIPWLDHLNNIWWSIQVTKPIHWATLFNNSIWVRYSAGLRAGWSGVRVPVGAWICSHHYRVQIGSGAHPASYPMGTRGSFPGVKRPGREADHSPPSSAEAKNAWSYTSTTPICLHGVVLS